MPGMLPSHRAAFLRAAAIFRVCLLVRETNPSSLQWIGRPGFTPKPISCKPKTADRDILFEGRVRRTAGLVVDPTAFDSSLFSTGSKAADAMKCWSAFREALGRGRDYDVNRNSDSVHFGCLRHHGRYIHGDYDLKDIIRVGHAKANHSVLETREGQPHSRSPLLGGVMSFLNASMGVPMVQHGSEAQYTGHNSEDVILGFGPGVSYREQQAFTEPYEFVLDPANGEVEQFYDSLSRRPIDMKSPLPGTLVRPPPGSDVSSYTADMRSKYYKPLGWQELRERARAYAGI